MEDITVIKVMSHVKVVCHKISHFEKIVFVWNMEGLTFGGNFFSTLTRKMKLFLLIRTCLSSMYQVIYLILNSDAQEQP